MKDTERNWKRVSAEQKRIVSLKSSIVSIQRRMDKLKGLGFFEKNDTDGIEAVGYFKEMFECLEDVMYNLERYEDYVLNAIPEEI